MTKGTPPLPERDHHGDIDVVGATKRFFRTRALAQLLLIVIPSVALLATLFILFHHYLPSYRELWYDFRPSEKELTYASSDQMQFVDEKNGEFLIWYETRPDGYKFYNQPGFYGAGKERERADTDEKIQMLKEWVDRDAAKKKQEEDQSSKLQQSQTMIDGLNAQIAQLKDSQKALQDKVTSEESEIADLQKQNKDLTSQAGNQNTSPTPTPNVAADSSTTPPPVEVVTDPAFYKHGAIMPPNPKPLAWFQSLRWGKYPGKPYVMNYNTGFFEIPFKPETRIAPHPHYIAKSTKTGQLERPYSIFLKINGDVPKEVQIPPLDEKYYQKTATYYGATFNSMYPYEVTAGGVTY